LQTGREVVFPACLFSTTPSNASTSQQASAIWRQQPELLQTAHRQMLLPASHTTQK
jgi:hypothetical protein